MRIPDALAKSLEDLVTSGRFETKTEAVRTALQALVEAERRGRDGELIAEAYRRPPQGAQEVESAMRAAIPLDP